jgi:ABC-2 type transport system permease protein
MRADWQYRTSFVLFLVSQSLIACFDLAVVATLFSQVDLLGGWAGMEVALLFGLGGVSFGLADLLVSQVETSSHHIKAGTLDLFLLRPVPTLLHLTASEFALRRGGRVLQPVVVLAVALVAAPIHWSPETVLLLPVAVLSGAVTFGGIWVVTSSISFWTVESQEVANAFTYGGGLMVQYPLDVLAAWLRRLATFAIPLAFVAYLPAARMLSRPDPLGLPSALAWASPAVAVAVAGAARAVWALAVRHYRSTGS